MKDEIALSEYHFRKFCLNIMTFKPRKIILHHAFAKDEVAIHQSMLNGPYLRLKILNLTSTNIDEY